MGFKVFNASNLGGSTVSPSKHSVTLFDIVSDRTERTADGTLFVEIVRKDVRKIELGFSQLTSDKSAVVTSLFLSRSGFTAQNVTVRGTLYTSYFVPSGCLVIEYVDPVDGTQRRIFRVDGEMTSDYTLSKKWDGLQISLVER